MDRVFLFSRTFLTERLNKYLRQVSKEFNVHLTLHSFRIAFGTFFAEKISIELAKEAVGHNNVISPPRVLLFLLMITKKRFYQDCQFT